MDGRDIHDPARSDTLLASSTPPEACAPDASVEVCLVANRYCIQALVGRGGMGAVYRARDTELDEVVALKVLNRELVSKPDFIERFRREVKLARRVTHPNVARVYDIGEHGGMRFLTMEFIEGEPLSNLLRRAGRLSIPRVIDVTAGVCAGLSAAHRAGVVHRDLKPDNVLLAKDGRAVITDFGIARDPVAAAAGETIGGVVGTPAYMAPEQVEASAAIDARTDIYALGVMLFELFTGKLPFEGSSAMMIAAARLYSPAPDLRSALPGLPDAVAEVVARCLAREREARFADAMEVAHALSSASPTLPLQSSPAKPSVAPASGVQPVHREKTIAVLPFDNLGGETDRYVAEGITDDLIDTLSMTAGLRVRPRGAVARFKGVDADPRDIGRELGVEVVVQGSVRRLESRVRLTARVTSVEDGFQLWARRFDRPANDLLVVSDETARAVAEALTAHMAGPKHVAPIDSAAIDLYLKAKAELRIHWKDSLERAVELLRAAHQRAPTDIAILSAFARACAQLWFYHGDGAHAEDARRLAEQAVQNAPRDPEALLAVATVRLIEGDPLGAAETCRRALERAPDNADARELEGSLLLEVGCPEQAIHVFESVMHLEPAHSRCRVELARAAALLGDYSKVRELIRGPLAERPGIGEVALRARLALWLPAEFASLVELEIPEAALPASPWQLLRGVRMMLRGEDVEQDLAGLESFVSQMPTAPRFMSMIHQVMTEIESRREQLDSALGHLEVAVGKGLIDLTWTDRCPVLEPLRRNPRFQAARAVIAERANAVRVALRG